MSSFHHHRRVPDVTSYDVGEWVIIDPGNNLLPVAPFTNMV